MSFLAKVPHPTRRTLPVIVFAVVLIGACNASISTAHLASLEVGASQDFSSPTSTFGPTDTIYAQAEAANIPNQVAVNFQVFAENVTGQAPNTHINQIDKSFEVASDATVTLTLTAPTAGWPTGTYKIVATMVDGTTQRDQKSAEFTVSSSGSAAPGGSEAPASSAAPAGSAAPSS